MDDPAPLGVPAISLASLKPAKAEPKPPISLIYGPPGIGKSSFVADAPGVLIMDFEDGLHNISAVKTPLITTYAEIISLICEVYSDTHDFKAVALDTLDALEPIMQAEICRRNGWKDIEAPGFGKGFGATAELFRSELLPGLRALRDDRGMLVFMTAHAITKSVLDPMSESYDRWQPRIHKALNELVLDNADIIAFATYRISTLKSDAGFGKTRARAIGTGERQLLMDERPTHVSKSRYAMPDVLPLEYAAFEAALTEAMNPKGEEKNGKT